MTTELELLHRAGVTLTEALLARNPGLAGRGLPTDEPAAWDHEADLQTAAEKWLRNRGYTRLSPDGIRPAGSTRGVFGHLGQPKGNPILPDLLIVGHGGRALGIELKTDTGRLSPDQQRLLSLCPWCHLARSLDEVERIVGTWEAKTEVQP